jgi:hypothetical protein
MSDALRCAQPGKSEHSADFVALLADQARPALIQVRQRAGSALPRVVELRRALAPPPADATLHRVCVDSMRI